MEKNVLVTGASRGIGFAICQELASQGWNLVATARSESELNRLRETILQQNPSNLVHLFAADLTNHDQRFALIEYLRSIHLKLDAIVLNAGVGLFKPIIEMTEENFNFVMDVNLRGTFFLTKELLPFIAQSSCPRVVGITSDVARRTFSEGSVYCMSKYAQDAFFHTLRKEWRVHQVRVSVVMPGLTDSTFGNTEAGAPYKAEWLKPEDIARIVHFILNSPPHVVLDEVMVHPFCQDW
jgi:NADP-dependent 3-hydroxy acid dehydrogenase YdfG